MIQVESLSKDYAGRQAVRDVTFSVAKGEILGFLGPNGAGKTTTMRILTGYLPPSGGRASIAGFDVTTESLEARRHIGYLPESVALYRELTVYDFLDFIARLRGVPAARRPGKIDLALQKLNLGEYRHRPIGALSKGYRQRVGIAQAVLHEPDVMILDEPTEGLDPRQRNETRSLIRELGKVHTVVLSTHILPEVEMTCDRVVIISGGRVVASDTPAGLSARAFAGQHLELLVGAEEGHVRLALKDIQGIVRLDAEAMPEHRCRVVIETEPKVEVRHLVARALIQAEVDLFEMKAGGHTLEDVFLELTRNDDAEAPRDGRAGSKVAVEEASGEDQAPDQDQATVRGGGAETAEDRIR
ncbi:MAG TPA: ABC transporter ATP-binding protein [Candidatus Dormibacteraeota bacterium]|jgi:ABC-2 type transport system ATP-binding protein|nr:ABC transporter ATP-binding protein [Candidatus Dormibacteraeota bacterium]